MADPLSIIGGVASILQISSMVVKLVKAVKGAPTERQSLLIEINSTTAVCQTLRDYAEIDAASWNETLKALSRNDVSPMAQFRQSLEYLQEKLGAKSTTDHKLQAWVQNLKWPFTKSELLELVANIERQKSLLNIALTNDTLRLTAAIRDETQRIGKQLEAVQLSQEEQGHDTRLIASSVKAVRLQQEAEAQSSQQREDLGRKHTLLNQLTAIDFEATHRDISSRRAHDTGQWLLDSSEYNAWRSNHTSCVMWCRGIPGAGKTVLSSLVLDSLRDSEVVGDIIGLQQARIGVAGIYCSYKSTQPTVSLLGSLLQQLLSQSPGIPDSLRSPPTVSDISKSLSELSTQNQGTFIVIDALDECPNRVELLKELRRFLQSSNTLHVFLTGRDSVAADVERELKPDQRLEIRSSEADVRSYLQQNFRTQGQLSEWIDGNPEFGEQIICAIISKVAGMFLLARLYMDLLSDIPTKRGVRKALDRLPVGVNNTYEEAWNRISAQSPQQCELGKKVLAWAVHATRSLRVSELREALAVEEGDDVVDPEGLLDATQLTSFCAGLIVVNEERQLINLIHPTTQEYFNTRKETLFPAAHEDMAIICITYLCMKPFRDQGALQQFEAFDGRRRSCPLLGYAAVNWGWHVQQANNVRTTNLSLSLLQDELARMATCQALFLNIIGTPQVVGSEWPEQLSISSDYPLLSIDYYKRSMPTLSGLHVAALFGVVDAADMLLQGSSNIDEVDSCRGTPLHWAILGQQDKMVDHLLEKGADPNAQRYEILFRRWPNTGDCTLPITVAAMMGNTAAIESLLASGAEIDRTDGSGYGTALSVALTYHHEEAVKHLLAKGADINNATIGIYSATMNGNMISLQMLIDSGASAKSLQTALEGAASACEYDMIVLLLRHGADPEGCRPQKKSTNESCSDCVKPMISDGDEQWERSSPLVNVIASEWCYGDNFARFKCLEALLDAGSAVNRLSAREYVYAGESASTEDIRSPPDNHYYTTPLFTAAYFKRLDHIQELVRRGANLNFTFGEHTTALSTALDGEGYVDGFAIRENSKVVSSSLRARVVIQLLIELGADINICASKDKARIEKLLNMSPVECDTMDALQRLVAQPPCFPDMYHNKNFHERRDQLRMLIDEGAEPELCCERDKRRIEEFLGWSEEELDVLDTKWEAGWRLREPDHESPL